MFAFFGLVLFLTAAPQASADTPSPAEVLARLDLSSFPNATGPGRREGGQQPRDYGFVIESGDARRAILETENRSWEIGLSIVETGPEGLKVCFTDIARNGGSYFVQTGLILRREGEAYRVSGRPGVDGCPEWRSRADSIRP